MAGQSNLMYGGQNHALWAMLPIPPGFVRPQDLYLSPQDTAEEIPGLLSTTLYPVEDTLEYIEPALLGMPNSADAEYSIYSNTPQEQAPETLQGNISASTLAQSGPMMPDNFLSMLNSPVSPPAPEPGYITQGDTDMLSEMHTPPVSSIPEGSSLFTPETEYITQGDTDMLSEMFIPPVSSPIPEGSSLFTPETEYITQGDTDMLSEMFIPRVSSPIPEGSSLFTPDASPKIAVALPGVSSNSEGVSGPGEGAPSAEQADSAISLQPVFTLPMPLYSASNTNPMTLAWQNDPILPMPASYNSPGDTISETTTESLNGLQSSAAVDPRSPHAKLPDCVVVKRSSAEELVKYALANQDVMTTMHPGRSGIARSGYAYVFPVNPNIGRWVDDVHWTSSRKGACQGDMIYREATKGPRGPARDRGFMNSSNGNEQSSDEVETNSNASVVRRPRPPRVTLDNCERALAIPKEYFHGDAAAAAAFAKKYVGVLAMAKDAVAGGLVKRTHSVIVDEHNKIVRPGSNTFNGKTKANYCKENGCTTYTVVSYYTLPDIVSGRIQEFVTPGASTLN